MIYLKKRWTTYFAWLAGCAFLLFTLGCASLPDQPLFVVSSPPASVRQPIRTIQAIGSIDTIDPLAGQTHSLLLRFEFPSQPGQPTYQREEQQERGADQKLQEQKRSPAPGSCRDDCFPTGITCSGGMLSKCVQADDDPCMDLIILDCLFGCEDNQCRIEEKVPISQSELLRKPALLHADSSCTGTKLGSVAWNTEGGLCRRPGRKDTNSGMLHAKSCCQRYFGVTSCTVDEGIVRPNASSPFHYIGCYRE